MINHWLDDDEVSRAAVTERLRRKDGPDLSPRSIADSAAGSARRRRQPPPARCLPRFGSVGPPPSADDNRCGSTPVTAVPTDTATSSPAAVPAVRHPSQLLSRWPGWPPARPAAWRQLQRARADGWRRELPLPPAAYHIATRSRGPHRSRSVERRTRSGRFVLVTWHAIITSSQNRPAGRATTSMIAPARPAVLRRHSKPATN